MIDIEEVTAILRRAASGESAITPDPERGDWYAECDPLYRIEGWVFIFFNDADDLDYLEVATAPDGRTDDFDGWWGRHEADPVDRLTQEEREALLGRLRAISKQVFG